MIQKGRDGAMTILGLETSTAVCSVGLFRDGLPEIEESLRESHIHSEKLLTLVDQVVRETGIVLSQLDAIAVSIGPGSFTGLRIGLSTAKGLAFALGKPLVAVSTFEAIAEAGRRAHHDASGFTVLIDAKKEEWYVGQFRVADGNTTVSMPVEVVSNQEVLAMVRRDASFLVLTDGVDAMTQLLGDVVTVEDVHVYCRGGVVASMAREKVLRKEFSDVAELEPVYLKDFVIRTAAPSP
jgi:tRNA threonylcarbamoyladenosine biosynthesis protein TsaB